MRDVDELLTQYVARLREAMSVEAVVLFGSRARGEALPDSDVDIAVVSPDFDGVLRRERIYQLMCLWPQSTVAIEPFGFTADELLALRGAFLWEIVADGRPLYDSGVFAAARQRLARLQADGVVARVPDGWRGWVEASTRRGWTPSSS